MREKAIMHVDADAYFLSVEKALNPELEGKPSAVTGGGRAVVLTASYEARLMGVSAGMPVSMARRSCPRLVCVNSRHAAYGRCGRALFTRMRELGGTVEQVSIDEAYIDVSELVRVGESTELLAEAARKIAREEFNLAVSVGVGSSRAVAKMATELAKPDGVYIVSDTQSFLSALNVARVPGIGPAMASKLADLDIHTIGQLAQTSPTVLKRRFGARQSAWLAAVAAGGDVHAVSERGPAKSIGAERTFPTDVSGEERVEAFETVLALALRRLHESGMAARTVSVHHRSAAGKDTSMSGTLEGATADTDELAQLARSLDQQLGSGRLRLAGVSFSSIGVWEQTQLDLLKAPPAELVALTHAEDELSQVCFYGMEVEHARFGTGRVVGLDSDVIRVEFGQDVRLLDVRSPKLRAEGRHWA